MRGFQKYSLVACLAFATSACNEVQTSFSDPEASAAADVELTSLDTSIDSLDESLLAFSESEDAVEIEEVNEVIDLDKEVQPYELLRAERPNVMEICRPARFSKCRSNGFLSVQKALFDSCLMPGTHTLATGEVQLKYNNPRCSIRKDNLAVRRTYDVTYEDLTSENSLYVTSTRQKNYRGDAIGGGGTLTNKEKGWNVEILGRNQILTNADGRELVNVSMKTLRPIHVVGGLKRKARIVKSGTLQVYHNLAEITATYDGENLAWVKNCKCPVSGKLNFKFEGKREAKGSVEFHGCGSMKITKGDRVVKTHRRPACQIAEDSE